MKTFLRMIACGIVVITAISGQGTSSSVSGVLVDLSGAPVAIAECRLTNQDSFFFSQEYTGIRPNFANQFLNVPTAAERNGNFSKLGKGVAFKPVHRVLDNWQVSGITSFVSGAPFTPGFSTSDGADLTGSTEGARIDAIGNPRLDKGQRTFYQNFNTAAFARSAKGGFGNGGVNYLQGPGTNNWDLSVAKRMPLFSEARFIQFRCEAFNAWNHTQFSGYYTSAMFNPAGNQIDPNFGAYSSSRSPRVIQLSVRVVF